MELKDKIALVTGGGQGIGQVIGDNLAKSGAHVIFGDIDLEKAKKSAEDVIATGGNASATLLNVADPKNVKVAFDSIVKEFKPIDILINNAGITKDGLLVRMKEDEWDRVLSVNLKGSFLCGQQAAKHMMKQRQGAIVNITSIVGVMGNAGQANYSASKAGLIGLTKTMARELAPRNITSTFHH